MHRKGAGGVSVTVPLRGADATGIESSDTAFSILLRFSLTLLVSCLCLWNHFKELSPPYGAGNTWTPRDVLCFAGAKVRRLFQTAKL